jgi:hypothetical protein
MGDGLQDALKGARITRDTHVLQALHFQGCVLKNYQFL